MKEILNKLVTKTVKNEIKNYISVEISLSIKQFQKSSPYASQIMNKYEVLYLHFVLLYRYFLLNDHNTNYASHIQNIFPDIFLKKRILSDKKDNYLSFLFKKYNKTLVNQQYDELFVKLREIKAIEFVILGIIHYLDIASVYEINYAISNLADFLIEYSAQAAYTKLKLTNLTYQQLKNNFIILGMGKYGGNELNFSSDIDIIIFYNNHYFSQNNLSNLHSFIRHFLNVLRLNSENGFLYRVDLRLRPEGSSGPLIMSISHATEYYKTRAKIWEYQAYIKNRLIWGGKNIYIDFSKNINNIIYSDIPKKKLLLQIRDIKAEIEKNIYSNENKINIKLSPGGIRDIEFILQFLQLLHGKKYEELRKTNSILGLNSLHTFKIITDDEYTTLHDNYVFFRIVENLLQFSDNIPVQLLPNDEDELKRILLAPITSNYFIKVKQIKEKIISKMKNVREIFTMLFDETIHFINLKNEIVSFLNESSNYQIDKKLIEDHFARMDSEYFIKFSKKNIVLHLQMIAKLNKNNLVELSIHKTDNCEWELSIIAFDYYYEFAKIAGLISLHHLTIISAESFTYSDYDKNYSSNTEFYRRHKKRIYLRNNDTFNLLKKRKIVCLIKIQSLSPNVIPNWDVLKIKLNDILELLENNQNKKAEEILNTQLFTEYKKIKKTNISSTIHPVNIKIDNKSSNTYTILHIKSTDTFAFLFTFTNLLSLKNYYIFKIEVKTNSNEIQNTFFITTRDGSKITNVSKIDELEILTMLIIQYSTLLHKTPNPNSALLYFYELISRIIESGNKNELPIIGQPDVLEKLSTLFGISNFMWEDFFRMHYKSLLPFLNDKTLDQKISKEELFNIFHNTYIKNQTIDYNDFIQILNEFKDKQMFRIDLRQIQKKIDFFEFANELTDLAEVIIELSLKKIERHLTSFNLKNIPPWAIFGLGKLGGRELGYASDIELLFVYDYDNSAEKSLISAYFEKFMQLFLKSIKTKREGIFEIDMNLRPYGKKGALAVSAETFADYFSQKGGAYFFERQALVKLRFITSNKQGHFLQKVIKKSRDNFVYSTIPPDYKFVRNMREKQISNYTKGPNINTKYSRGALVDIEYLTQLLQIKHGHQYISLQKHSTLDALDALHDKNIIDETTYKDLTHIYIFYRNLINALRMEKGNAKNLTIYDTDSLEFDYLVQRVYFTNMIDKPKKELLQNKLDYSLKKIEYYFNLFTK